MNGASGGGRPAWATGPTVVSLRDKYAALFGSGGGLGGLARPASDDGATSAAGVAGSASMSPAPPAAAAAAAKAGTVGPYDGAVASRVEASQAAPMSQSQPYSPSASLRPPASGAAVDLATGGASQPLPIYQNLQPLQVRMNE